MFILFAWFIALDDQHIKMQSIHRYERDCIKAAIVLKMERPELKLKCIEVI
jgi:hypothetical protein